MQYLKKSWSVVSKMAKSWWNLTRALESLQNLHFICSYCEKYLMFDLKKHRGVNFHNTEGWCKIWRKTDLWFGKWHGEYSKFSSEHLKVSKLALWWDVLIWRRKSLSLKSTEELCVMTLKNDAKFEKELTCHFKIDMRNWTNFDPGTWKSQKFPFKCAPFEQSIYCLS